MPEPSAVLDSGPMIGLASIGRLELVGDLYPLVLAPPAVYREVVLAGHQRPGAHELAGATWIRWAELEAPPSALIAGELGAGEAEVITLAHHLGIRRVLLDDRRARRVARLAYGLEVRGSAGILVAAKRAGRLARVRPELENLRARGYYLSDRVIEHACQAAGE